MKRSGNNRRAFYVVQFIELPFEGIDDYVCVPYNWLVARRATDDKASVAYPKDEDPFDTRDRVERKETYGATWRSYMAAVKYESDTYRDAEYWIATRNDYGPLVEKELTVSERPSRFRLNNKLRCSNQSNSMQSNDNPWKPLPSTSIKRPAQSELKKQHNEKRLKPNEAAQSSSAVVNDANADPGCSKKGQSIIIQENQLMECAQIEETAAASNGDRSTEPRTQTQRIEQNEQALSLPVIDEPMVVMKLATYNNDHQLHVNNVSNNEPTSHHFLHSMKMAANLYSHMNGARRLVPSQETVEKRIRPMNITKNLALAAQRPLNLMDQTGSPSTYSVTEQSTVVTQNRSQDSPQVQKLSTENKREQIAPIRSSSISSQDARNINNHQYNSRTIRMRTPSMRLNSTDPSNLMYQTSEISQQRQLQPNQQESQQQQQRPKIRIDISIKPKSKWQMSTIQGVTKKKTLTARSNVLSSLRQALSTTQNNCLLNEQQLQATLSAISTEYNHTSSPTGPQNIAASATRDNHNLEMKPTSSFQKLPRIQHRLAHRDINHSQRTQKEVINQYTGTNSTAKRVPFMNNVATSTTNRNYVNVTNNACQTNECMMEDPLSPYHVETSDSDTVTDHDVMSDHEMSTDEAPVETTNDVRCTGIASGRSLADKPTALNSTSPNDLNSKVVLEQQMLQHFGNLVTQMGSTLRYTCDMFNNLRSSILETADSFRNLLDLVERFNSLENSTSNPFPLSNVTPGVPQASEETHTEVTASAYSCHENQRSNNVAAKATKKIHKNKRRFVLPLEYDPHDTKWTLKYRTELPGLVELVPQSDIYVSYGDLKYCELVSKDCKSLARRLLSAVFNKKALSVCLSMSEKQAFNNDGSDFRPELDKHAFRVLIRFVLDYGLQCGWKTDLKPILRTLHSMIQKIRYKSESVN